MMFSIALEFPRPFETNDFWLNMEIKPLVSTESIYLENTILNSRDFNFEKFQRDQFLTKITMTLYVLGKRFDWKKSWFILSYYYLFAINTKYNLPIHLQTYLSSYIYFFISLFLYHPRIFIHLYEFCYAEFLPNCRQAIIEIYDNPN